MVTRLRTLVLLVGMLAGVAGGISAAPREAEAAGPSVTACFDWTTGAAYANSPVYLYKWNGSKYIQFRSGKTNASGCGTFYNLNANNYYYVRAYSTVRDCGGWWTTCVFDGYTNAYRIGSSGNVNFGWWYVFDYVI